jgi:hypothetical protein
MVRVGQRKLIDGSCWARKLIDVLCWAKETNTVDGSCWAKETNRWFMLGKGN